MKYLTDTTKLIFFRHIYGHAPYICLLTVLCCWLSASADNNISGAVEIGRQSEYFLRGIVRDSISNSTLPYASASVSSGHGTVADSRGIFEMTVPDTASWLTVSCQGYRTTSIHIAKNRINTYAVYLSPEPQMLGEVVVTKQRYSKKNNPAVDMINRIRRTADTNDPARHPYFSYDKYQRITMGLNDVGSREDPNALLKRFPFLWDNVDTSEISGKTILNLIVKETTSHVDMRRDPRTRHERVTGRAASGIDEIADKQSMQLFFDDVLREIDLYDKDINLLQNRFVSPLSPLAPDFYKFYLTDSATETDGSRSYTISFYPHNKATFGFIGQLKVIPSDSDIFIGRVDMRVSPEINLNFIQTLAISQTFAKAPDGSRLKLSDDLRIEASIIPGLQGLYARRRIAYSTHSFEPPADLDAAFDTRTTITVDKLADSRDETFWNEARLIDISPAEAKVSMMMERLRANRFFRYAERGAKMLFSGYIPTGKPSKFDIGPLNTMISWGDLDGLRLRFGGMTTANLSPRWFTRFYGAYGFKDHRWKYGIELEYSFVDKVEHSREFPMHSIRFNSLYDVDRLGQHYYFTNADNFVLSLKRGSNDLLPYHYRNSALYTLELSNHFSVMAEGIWERHSPSRLLGFDMYDGTELKHFDSPRLEVTLRYAPGEKFYQTRSYRFPINMDAPVIILHHSIGSVLYATRDRGSIKPTSAPGINLTELTVQKRFWLSAWGYIDIMAKGGHIWSKNTPYTKLFTPNANLSYTIQPESFALVNPLEFVTDSYCWLDMTYWLNGALLNYIPGIKRLKLREVVSARSYWGRLTEGNDPRIASKSLAFPEIAGCGITDISHIPYIEVSAGLDNIFKCLRLDYVWRITHRHPPYEISRSGLRVAVHVTF